MNNQLLLQERKEIGPPPDCARCVRAPLRNAHFDDHLRHRRGFVQRRAGHVGVLREQDDKPTGRYRHEIALAFVERNIPAIIVRFTQFEAVDVRPSNPLDAGGDILDVNVFAMRFPFARGLRLGFVLLDERVHFIAVQVVAACFAFGSHRRQRQRDSLSQPAVECGIFDSVNNHGF